MFALEKWSFISLWRNSLIENNLAVLEVTNEKKIYVFSRCQLPSRYLKFSICPLVNDFTILFPTDLVSGKNKLNCRLFNLHSVLIFVLCCHRMSSIDFKLNYKVLEKGLHIRFWQRVVDLGFDNERVAWLFILPGCWNLKKVVDHVLDWSCTVGTHCCYEPFTSYATKVKAVSIFSAQFSVGFWSPPRLSHFSNPVCVIHG